MLDILENLRMKAAQRPVRIIFPEGEDERVVDAARNLPGKLTPVLVRKEKMDGIECLWPAKDKNFDSLCERFYEKNKGKFTIEDSRKLLETPLYYAAMKLECGDVDGFVGGADNSTADTVRALLRTVGLKEGVRTLSSFFLMCLENRNFIFADCAIIPSPSAEQLADIAVEAASSCRRFLGVPPKVAFLSFSTAGSAKTPEVEKVLRAVENLSRRNVDFEFFGEIQADAAIVPEIASKKTKGKWKGDANVLIFPDLSSGNISYKLVERLAGARAIGPILQGLKKPGNDLSRGCSKNDIIDVAAVTSLQVEEING